MNAPVSKRWTERHPQIRGNRHNERLFASDGAVAEPFGLLVAYSTLSCQETAMRTVVEQAEMMSAGRAE